MELGLFLGLDEISQGTDILGAVDFDFENTIGRDRVYLACRVCGTTTGVM